MGIQGLTSFVESLPRGKGEVWESYELRDTKLIIDGNGLYHYLYANYQLDCKHGGQYSELEEKAKMFFAKLMSHRVVPYVIFDGIMDDTEKKLHTTEKRKAERIARAYNLLKSRSEGYNRATMLLPPLTRIGFIQVLQELGLSYAVADFEADGDVASLANALDGPVMGLDSDYFIFDIKQGYIPFHSYDMCGPSMIVKKLYGVRLATHLKISSVMLPMLASLLGNDYVSAEVLMSFKASMGQPTNSSNSTRKANEISSIATFLSCWESIDEVMVAVTAETPENKRAEFRKALCLSTEQYQIKPTHLLGYFQTGELGSSLLTYNGYRLPLWVIKLFREGTFGVECMNCLCRRRVFLKVQVEDIMKPSAHQCTVQIRLFLYKTMMKYDKKLEHTAYESEGKGMDKNPVKSESDVLGSQRKTRFMSTKGMIVNEYDREKLTLKTSQLDLEMVAPETNYVNIDNIPTMSKEEKMAYLLNVLSCEQTLVQHLPIQWQLVVAVLRYWYINAKPQVSTEHLAALLVCHVGQKQECERDMNTMQYHELYVKGLHGFSQWQSVAYWANNLSTLFGPHVFPVLRPAKLYNGVEVCKLYHRLKSCGIEMTQAFVSDVQLFQELYNAVLKDIPDYCKFTQPRSKQSKEIKKDIKTVHKSKEILKGNHFALLSISSDTDEED